MIYKPTDLSPSAQTFDVKDTPIFFECKVDSSNVRAEGYTIKVLNSENNVVFSSIPEGQPLDIKYISLIRELNTFLSDSQFESYTTGYNLLNTGYNGTYLKFPFSLDFNDKNISSNTLKNTQIFYSKTNPNDGSESTGSGLYRYITYAQAWRSHTQYYKDNIVENKGLYYLCLKNNIGTALTNTSTWKKVAYEPVEIYNGQEYKWSITLYQLENTGTERVPVWTLPENPLYYDMSITTGTVLGSCNTRIQSVLSEDIYADYYVQPVVINELNFDRNYPMAWSYVPDSTSGGSAIKKQDSNSVNRAMIKSYDSSYGYIYPNDGSTGFPGNTIVKDRVNAFRIYKYGNDVDNLSAYQQVSYVCENSLDNREDSTWNWEESLANPGESYGEMTYYADEEPDGTYKVPGMNNFVLKGSERIILNRQDTQSSYNQSGDYIGSPYNGIFYPDFSYSTYGDYNENEGYYKDDRVLYNGDVYVCKGVVENHTPVSGSSYWTSVDSTAYTEWDENNIYSDSNTYNQNDYCWITTTKKSASKNLYLCKTATNYSPQYKSDFWEEKEIKTVNYQETYDIGNVIRLISMGTYYLVKTQFTVNENVKESEFATKYKDNIEKIEDIYTFTSSDGISSSTEYSANSFIWYTERQYSYYQCTGKTLGQEPSSSSIYWNTTENSKAYQIVVKWYRVPDADTWGELKNKVVLVTSSQSPYYGKNLQLKSTGENSEEYGTINQTPFRFVEEEPIEIYNNYIKPYDSTQQYKYGDAISYVCPSSTSGTWSSTSAYTPGQIVSQVVNNEASYYICIKEVDGKTTILLTDTEYWSPYKKNNYFVCISTVPIAGKPPVNGTTVNQTYWRENPYLNNTGLIFYNQAIDSKNKEGYLYIRHFDGISNNMQLFKNTTTNEQYYFNIINYNSDYNFVKYKVVKKFDGYKPYSNTNPAVIADDVNWNIDSTKYQIKTFFRESDENAFYFYTAPVVSLHYANSNDVDFVEDKVLTKKYYTDYVGDIPEYDSTKIYNIGEIYWKINEKTEKKEYFEITAVDSTWDTKTSSYGKPTVANVTPQWTDKESYTTDYCKYFLYEKDDLAIYDNKRDFLLWEKGKKYSYGDKILFNSKYYICKKNNNTTGYTPEKATDYWSEITFDDGVETRVIYIAMANVNSGDEYMPKNSNIGLYWQQYIGVLFEDEGYVNASYYYSNINYEVGTNILYNGLYLYVTNPNKSFAPSPSNFVYNEHGSIVWEPYTTYSEDDLYEDGAKEWGAPIGEESGGAQIVAPGQLCEYNATTDKWSLYNGVHLGDTYVNGLNTTSSTTFDENTVYIKTATVFYEGYAYVCVAESSLHVPTFNGSGEYFTRNAGGKPLNYSTSTIKSWEYTNKDSGKTTSINKRKYLMGDIALSKANLTNGLPDRYWVKIRNTNEDDIDGFIPNLAYWETYNGSMFNNTGSNYVYNNTVLDENTGLYFIKKNTDSKYSELEPISPTELEEWSVSTQYDIGDIVVYNNTIYINKDNQTSSRPSINSSYWDVYPWQLFIPEITERTLKVSAEYDQQQYVQWKSAQWFLFDGEGENIKEKSAVLYDGDLSYTFHGLDGRDESTGEDRYFIVRLILETYNGYRLTLDQTVEVMFSIKEIKSEGLIDVAFDCDTASVVTTITKESGFIIPSDTAEYAAVNSNNSTDGEMTLTGDMKYQKVATSIDDASRIATASPILSASERFVQQVDYTINTDKFCGTLVGLQSFSGPNSDVENKTSNSKKVGDFEIFVPEFFKEVDENDYPDDDILSDGSYSKLNENRNRLRWKSAQIGTSYEDDVTIAVQNPTSVGYELIAGDLAAKNESTGEYLLEYEYCETVPLWQRKGYIDDNKTTIKDFQVYKNTNVLPISFELTKDNSDSKPENKYLNVAVPYNIYTKLEDQIGSSPSQDFFLITNPIVPNNHFSSSSVVWNTPIYPSAQFVQNGENNTEEITIVYVKGNTSTLWSDYKFKVPTNTLVGLDENGNEMYTSKNVWDTVGWKWEDNEIDESVWSDSDYMETYKGYNSFISSISLNDDVIEETYFTEQPTQTVEDSISKTLFMPQEKQPQTFKEREFLNGRNFLFDLDLTMDADGYITPTSIEEFEPQEIGYLKVVAYTNADKDKRVESK